MKPRVSIIIPLYNKAEYVADCLKSVLSQGFFGLEVIVVDDGSRDDSLALALAEAKEHPEIRVFSKTNGGVTAARRYGLERARADFVMFVDPDDRLMDGAVEALYSAIVRENADEVIGNYITQNQRRGISPFQGLVDYEPLVNDLLAIRNSFCVLWGIIFRRSLLLPCLDTPREVIEREDSLMQIKFLMLRPRVFFIPQIVYFYNEGLPNQRRVDYSWLRLYEEQLHKALLRDGQKFRCGWLINQLKNYELMIRRREFHALVNYKHLKAEMREFIRSGGHLPLLDRLAYALPCRLSYLLISLFDKLH